MRLEDIETSRVPEVAGEIADQSLNDVVPRVFRGIAVNVLLLETHRGAYPRK